MKKVAAVAAVSIVALFVAGCVEPPVKPIPEASRRGVTAVSADVSGIKHSDTSTLGARGSDEGGRLGAMQGAAAVLRNSGGSLLVMLMAPIGAAAGGAKGASEARTPEIVDQARSDLRLAVQETDFTEMLRQRLAATKTGGDVQFTVTAGASSAPTVTGAGVPVSHVIALEYQLAILREYLVNPLIGIYVAVTAQVQSADRKQLVHTATWTYCGPRFDFVQMSANGAAAIRAQMEEAAVVLAAAIPHDLYVSKEPRKFKVQEAGNGRLVACMDYSDLPIARGTPIPVDNVAPPPAAVSQKTPVAQPPAAPAGVVPVAATTPAVAQPKGIDGTWRIEMQLTNGSATNPPCPNAYSGVAQFSNGVADSPRGKLSVAEDGKVSGWVDTTTVGTTAPVPFIVSVAGQIEGSSGKGSVTGRCVGSLTMTKQ